MANRLLSFARLAHDVAREAVPERAHRFAPKRYTQPQLLACLLVKEYLRLDYRTAQETLEASDGLRDALGLTAVPDYSTLWRGPVTVHLAHDKATADVVATALVETVRRFKASGHDPPGPPVVAIDSTGLFCGHASRYFDQRRSKTATATYAARGYQKWAAALWTGPQLVTAQLSKPGPSPPEGGEAGTTRTSRPWRRPRSPRCRVRSSSPTPGTTASRSGPWTGPPRVLSRAARGPRAHPSQDAPVRRRPPASLPGRDGGRARMRHARRGGARRPARDVPPALARRDAARPPRAAGRSSSGSGARRSRPGSPRCSVRRRCCAASSTTCTGS